MFKCRQICFLFSILFCGIQVVFGQVYLPQDSLLLTQQDTIIRPQNTQDSLNLTSIRTDIVHPDYYLDSIKEIVVVKDNNFIRWMDKVNTLNLKKNTIQKDVAPVKPTRPSWILWVILALFIFIGLIRIFFYNIFHNIVFGFYNDRVLAQINKEDSILTSWPYIFLFTTFTFGLGLFITIYNGFIYHPGEVNFLLFLKTSLLIAALFILKLTIVKIIGVLFEIEKLVREYIVFLYLFYFNSGLILMPLLIFIAFLPAADFNFLLILLVCLVSILFIFRFLRGVFILMEGLRFPIFYLILYLCTLEIAPILILVKSLNK